MVPRKTVMGKPISASYVRQLLQKKDFVALKNMVPATTLDYFQSPEAVPVIEKICHSENVVHY